MDGLLPRGGLLRGDLVLQPLRRGLRRLSDKGRFHAGLFFNRYTLIALLLVALAVGWLRDNTGAVATHKQQASVVDGAQALAVAEALSAPALQSRALGSEGMWRAAAQIAAEFEALGLQAAGNRSVTSRAKVATTWRSMVCRR
ncbi:MAG: hypothetical protein H6637_01135 [Ardenticatenales bacterium]|nr:hypothetical protein [Ardenticatenales bacterium]